MSYHTQVKALKYATPEDALKAWAALAKKENEAMVKQAPTPKQNTQKRAHPSRDRIVACLKATKTPLTVREVSAMTGVTYNSAKHIIRKDIRSMLTTIPCGRGHKHIIEDDKETV